MTEERGTIVVGIGLDVRDLLEQIHRRFVTHQATQKLRVIWVTPFQRDHAFLETHPMPLDSESLNHLYFSAAVRDWSGANWKRWGHSLASNRLFGKLAAYKHQGPFYNRLGLMFANLHRPNVYVIAPLHEPFASGAYLDLAYVLHKRALNYKSQVFGMLLLPGMLHDPVVRNDQTESDQQLRQALTYAALRELHFHSSRLSFYDNHSDAIPNDHTESSPLNLPIRFDHRSPQSPFQTGDCYLVGGEVSEPVREPAAPLDYELVKTMCADFIYLQSCTAIGSHLRQRVSDKNQSLVSSFGLINTSDVDENDGDIETKEIAYLLVQDLLNDLPPDNRLKALIDKWVSTPFYEMSGDLDVPVSNRRYAERQQDTMGLSPIVVEEIFHLDQFYQNAIVRLLAEEQELSRQAATRREQIDEKIATDIQAMQQMPDVTAYTLRQFLNDGQRQVEQAYQQGQTLLDEIENQTQALVRELRAARAQYLFVTALYLTPLLTIAPYGLAVLLTALLIFLMGTGLLVEAMLWLGVGIVVPLGGAYWLQRRRSRNARTQFSNLQAQLLDLQNQLMSQRMTNAYLHRLREALQEYLAVPETTLPARPITTAASGRVQQRHEHLWQQLQSAANTLRPKDLLTVKPPANRTAMARALLEQLWYQSANAPITHQDILNIVSQQVMDQSLQEQSDEMIVFLQRNIDERLDRRVRNVLSTNVMQIGEQWDNMVTKYVALANWGNVTEQQVMREFLQVRQLEAVDISADVVTTRNSNNGHVPASETVTIPTGSTTDAVPGSMPSSTLNVANHASNQNSNSESVRQATMIRIRNNIPMRALLYIEQWYNAYRQVTRIRQPQADNVVVVHSWLHPTRMGMATPHILTIPPESMRLFPPLVMVITTFVHLLKARALAEQLCVRLHVDMSYERINYDELCSALQQDIDAVNIIIVAARTNQAISQLNDSQLRQGLQLFIREYMTLFERGPRAGDEFADWEEWTMRLIRDEIDNRRLQTAITLIAQLYYLIRDLPVLEKLT